MSKVPSHFYRQSGVVPFRWVGDGLELLLITSMRRKKWIIPKGVVEPELSAEESAQMEAEEEAGVRGWVHLPALGSYRHSKWGGTCEVEVFLLEVEEVLDEWPEAGARARKWVSCKEAARRVRPEGLRKLIRQIPDLWKTIPRTDRG